MRIELYEALTEAGGQIESRNQDNADRSMPLGW